MHLKLPLKVNVSHDQEMVITEKLVHTQETVILHDMAKNKIDQGIQS